MYLILDGETSGLIRRDVPLGDDSQPWFVRLAVLLEDAQGRTWNALDVTIRPDGRKVKQAAFDVHGIDPNIAERYGVAENAVLSMVADLAGKARYAISFSGFDKDVMESLMVRLETKLGKPFGTYRSRWIRPGLEFIDVQKPAAQTVCKLPPNFEGGDFRWPSLDEACAAVLGEAPREGHHDAWDDLKRTARLFRALKAKGFFEIQEL